MKIKLSGRKFKRDFFYENYKNSISKVKFQIASLAFCLLIQTWNIFMKVTKNFETSKLRLWKLISWHFYWTLVCDASIHLQIKIILVEVVGGPKKGQYYGHILVLECSKKSLFFLGHESLSLNSLSTTEEYKSDSSAVHWYHYFFDSLLK